MEKHRIKSGSEFSRRLLVLFFVFCFVTPVHAKFLTNKDFESIRFSSQKSSDASDYYTNVDICFETVIPFVEPGEIEIFSPEDMDNVSFRTLKRTQWNDEEGEPGTKIEAWYSFSKKGTYTLTPLTVRVQGFKRNIQFNPVTIKLNPKAQDPIVIIRFADGKTATSEDGFALLNDMEFTAGQKVSFEVLFQYGVQLINLHWDLPKDSIFTQTKAHEIIQTKYIEKANLDEIVPVSGFEWTPLVSGAATFPVVSLTLTSNNGYKGEVKIPSIPVTIGERKETGKQTEATLFDQAFEAAYIEEVKTEKPVVTALDCEELAELRIKERKSILGLGKTKRVEKETSLGLPSGTSEFKLLYIYASIFFLVLSLIFFALKLKKKSVITNIITTAIVILAASVLVVSIVASKKLHGISRGNQLYSIPDNLSEAKSELQPGSYVEIKESSGEWYYVLLGESGGWCKKDQIIVIK
ncbi:MAG: hypothetical protein MJ179_07655 [Treponema sp.]|nr:hypothetical protein [Treponema sp.]